MSNSADGSLKAEDAYPTGAPGISESGLLIYFWFFMRVTLVTSCSLLCVSVFPV